MSKLISAIKRVLTGVFLIAFVIPLFMVCLLIFPTLASVFGLAFFIFEISKELIKESNNERV